jgi:hypothetical protein
MAKLNAAISRREQEIKAMKRIKRLCLDGKLSKERAATMVQNSLDNILLAERHR